jgi:hypothetical protein
MSSPPGVGGSCRRAVKKGKLLGIRQGEEFVVLSLKGNGEKNEEREKRRVSIMEQSWD